MCIVGSGEAANHGNVGEQEEAYREHNVAVVLAGLQHVWVSLQYPEHIPKLMRSETLEPDQMVRVLEGHPTPTFTFDAFAAFTATLADYHTPPAPEAATDATPGSPEKVAVLIARESAGRHLYHPADWLGVEGVDFARLAAVFHHRPTGVMEATQQTQGRLAKAARRRRREPHVYRCHVGRRA